MKEGLTLLALIVVLILVLIASYYTTKLVGRQLGTSSQWQVGQNIKIVERLSMGKDQHIIVADVAGRYLVLGCTPTQISHLCELTPEESAQLLEINTSYQGNIALSFSQWMQKIKETKKD